MAFSTRELTAMYRKRAAGYDRSVLLFRWLGLSLERYRRLAITALRLRPGDLVLDLGCGTGLNFPHLQRAVGPTGQLIGVDLTDRMLERAAARVARAGWSNVELVRTDLASYRFPDGVGGVLSTLALTLEPSFDDVVRRAAQSLRDGGRVAICDLRRPDGWPEWLVRFAARLNRPFGVTLDLAGRHPWESVRRYLTEVEFRELCGGAIYLSVGERTGAALGEDDRAG
jgi:ubiquinone/menaquinone biosynthesis C-methylase UbiE